MSNSTNQTAASANGSAALAVRNSSPTSTRLNEQYQLNHLADEINHLHMECCRAAGDAVTRAIAAGDLLLQTGRIEFIAETLAEIPDETWEESSYRGLAADLVSACNQLTAPLRIRDKTNDTLKRLNRKTRASLIFAIDDRVLMLGEYLKCIGFYDEVASEFEALRVAIEEAVK